MRVTCDGLCVSTDYAVLLQDKTTNKLTYSNQNVTYT